jgi:general secretion pathway protein G
MNWKVGVLEKWKVGELVGRQKRELKVSVHSPHCHWKRGFTLIELIVVISLIFILAGLAIVQYRRSVVYSREAVLKDDLYKMRDAIDQYYADKNQYPASLSALVSDGYLRALPRDPFTDSDTTWQEIPAEPDANNPAAAPGVYDVKSGADGTALDGTSYAEW